jgi:hypothetical protein
MISIEADPREVIAQLQKLERFEKIAQGHIRQAMGDVVGQFVSSWQAVAPVASGEYQGSIVGKVTRVVGLEARGIASTDAIRGGFPYPSALETAARIRSAPNPHRRKVRKLAESKIEQISNRFWQALERIVSDLVVR